MHSQIVHHTNAPKRYNGSMKDERIPRYMELRNKLEYYRKKNNLTQEDVVARLSSKYEIDVDRSSVSHWESGVEPNFSTICALAEIYGVKIDDLKPGRIIEDLPEKDKESKMDILKQLQEYTSKEDSNQIATYLNDNARMFSDKGIHEINLGLIRRIVGQSNADWFLDINNMPVIASKLKDKGYHISRGEIGHIDNTYFRVILPGGEVAGRKFEDDLASILIDFMHSSALTKESNESTLSEQASEIRNKYQDSIESLMNDTLGEAEYYCEFEYKGIADSIDLSTKEDLFYFLETVEPEICWISGIPGSIAKENIGSFIESFKKSDVKPSWHIYWLEKAEDDSYVDHEEDFAYSKDEFTAKMAQKKRHYFELEVDEKYLQKSKIFEACKDKIIQTDLVDEIIEAIEKEK